MKASLKRRVWTWDPKMKAVHTLKRNESEGEQRTFQAEYMGKGFKTGRSMAHLNN